ncbi:MAG: cytochrome C [Bacteroidetes bacterium]|nr:cytochrome C [Bacteroidota bacterium]
MKKLLLLGWVVLGALILIQFIKPTPNQSSEPQANYIGTKHEVPTNVKTILDKACMDCHSNNTRYPWYASVQPIAWWIANHIKDGKKHLNFDEYTQRSLRYQYHKMEETVEMMEEKEMPLSSYTLTHTDARLSYEERVAIMDWAHAIMENMKARYPMDSLRKKSK